MPVLDTDILSALRFENPAIVQRVNALSPQEVFASQISAVEMWRGGYDVLNREHAQSLRAKPNQFVAACSSLGIVEFLCSVPILTYTAEAERVFQAMPTEAKRGRANDCRIAAIALVHGLPVATRNTRDFAKIPGVLVEDWT